MIDTPQKKNRRYTHLRLQWRRYGMSRKLAFLLAATAIVSGTATFSIMTGSTTFGSEPKTIISLLYFDAVIILMLGVLVARRLAKLWIERRRGHAGSGLHARLVMLFSLVSVIPTILVTVFAGFFLFHGLQNWFGDKVKTAVNASQVVAKSYLAEHRENIISDALAIANDLNRNASRASLNQDNMTQFLTAMSQLRGLSEVAVVDGSGRFMARSAMSVSIGFVKIQPQSIEDANKKGFVRLETDEIDRVRVLVKLNRFIDTYLLVGRSIDPKVTEYIERTKGAVSEYQNIEKSLDEFQVYLVAVFIFAALLLLMVSVWFGLTIATQLASPIIKLISASERVSKGDLSVRVDSMSSSDELGTLIRTFNRMTSQLEQQREGLMSANQQLDERRRFTQAVLSGVSAGVIGLDAEGRINLPNRSASELLSVDLTQHELEKLEIIVPEMAELITNAMNRPDRLQQAEIKLIRNGAPTTLLVRIAGEKTKEDVIEYVVTFDDVTELLSAQRKAAWADVARRIAHEIKNPLTPIQLSAERLKRKYLKEITSDPETFKICTETIVRQVEDIGRMVDEFSSFARMPQPKFKPENLSDICRHAVFLEKNRVSDISYDTELLNEDIYIRCDSHQLGQVLTNILKNAAESILEHKNETGQNSEPGTIKLCLATETAAEGHNITITIEDNGRGLPTEGRDRLTEPYVTTRKKGTGLGLAIVKKIMEDHDGDLILEDRDGAANDTKSGARAIMIFRSAKILSENELSDDTSAQSTEEKTLTTATHLHAHGS
jgi:two-component system, NtrC family, nitrogen regulation sensor histidine kinase NtrY